MPVPASQLPEWPIRGSDDADFLCSRPGWTGQVGVGRKTRQVVLDDENQLDFDPGVGDFSGRGCWEPGHTGRMWLLSSRKWWLWPIGWQSIPRKMH